MGTQDSARPAVTVGDVLAVLDLARSHLDTSAPAPASWDAVIAKIRAVLLEQTVPPAPEPVTEEARDQLQGKGVAG